MTTRRRASWARGVRILVVAAVGLATPSVALAQAAPGGGTVAATQPDRRSSYPQYSLARELTLAGVGAGFALGTALVTSNVRSVPSQGLDATAIAWSVDREVLGDLSSAADRSSDRTRELAAAYPFVLAWATSPGERWSALGRRSLLYAEAFWITGGITYLTKELVGRPRPFTYASSAERASSSAYDVATESAFESMPSGHASSSFLGAGLSITEYLLRHPDASGLERFGVAALGGALGGSTAALRVQAGKHFPSDVLVGAGIGLGTGVALPLLHRGERRAPSGRAWLQAAGGLAVGAITGAALASVAY
ncbi:MAG: phosphatase PAP2 family protein [Gemmatimonadetes bacterium]|nr:phosphatase PAP2 family protein [Gemmatimonadota bacterium]